jgi:Asp/Glu/hydantoin racemase
MSRILVINPNCSTVCSSGISAAIDCFRTGWGPSIDVATLQDGPPAIYTWRDWHGVVDPLCRMILREAADVYVVACASDPGIEAARATTARPVLGVFRSAVAAAAARVERFGIIAIVEASKARHRAALRSMGLEPRLAGHVAVGMSMEDLLSSDAALPALEAAAARLAEDGAEAVILGCTGMAHHCAAVEKAVGLPVIEPCQAATALALGIVLPQAAANRT